MPCFSNMPTIPTSSMRFSLAAMLPGAMSYSRSSEIIVPRLPDFVLSGRARGDRDLTPTVTAHVSPPPPYDGQPRHTPGHVLGRPTPVDLWDGKRSDGFRIVHPPGMY